MERASKRITSLKKGLYAEISRFVTIKEFGLFNSYKSVRFYYLQKAYLYINFLEYHILFNS